MYSTPIFFEYLLIVTSLTAVLSALVLKFDFNYFVIVDYLIIRVFAVLMVSSLVFLALLVAFPVDILTPNSFRWGGFMPYIYMGLTFLNYSLAKTILLAIILVTSIRSIYFLEKILISTWRAETPPFSETNWIQFTDIKHKEELTENGINNCINKSLGWLTAGTILVIIGSVLNRLYVWGVNPWPQDARYIPKVSDVHTRELAPGSLQAVFDILNLADIYTFTSPLFWATIFIPAVVFMPAMKNIIFLTEHWIYNRDSIIYPSIIATVSSNLGLLGIWNLLGPY